MRKVFILFLLCVGASSLVAQYEEHKTPEQIEQELQSAEAQFQKAKKMFNPWYTGPLQTPGASMMPPGWGNMQPYLNLTDNYARFDKSRHSHKQPSHLINLNPTVSLAFGVTPSTDVAVGFQGNVNWQYGHSGAGFGDMGLAAGFLIASQTLHVPAIKFCIKEFFPTGRYQHLNTNGLGLDATGGGSFQTQFTFTLSKVVFWDYLHPMNYRLSFSYNIPTPVTVHNFNTYGGGFGTHAKVHPGNTFTADTALEVSLTQHWVIATDVVYTATNRTTHSGSPGITTSGDVASLGSDYSDNLSLAPAIEYNWNENLGLLAGAWFSVYGRNSSNFATGIISVTWTFQVK